MAWDFNLPFLNEAKDAANTLGDLTKVLLQLLRWAPFLIIAGGIVFVINKVA